MMEMVVGMKVMVMMAIVIESRTMRVEIMIEMRGKIMTEMMKKMNLNSSFFFSRVCKFFSKHFSCTETKY